jgi:hypothetical protein
MAEANKYVAGEWKRAHAPASALRWLARFHQWRLGGAEGAGSTQLIASDKAV